MSVKVAISSSKIDNAAHSDFRKVCVFAGLLAAVDTGVDVPAWGLGPVLSTIVTVIKLRIRCFDLRTQWYSHQSNRLMNWLI